MAKHVSFRTLVAYEAVEEFAAIVRLEKLVESEPANGLSAIIDRAIHLPEFANKALRYPELRKEAVGDAVAAGMIIFSIQACVRLPFHVKCWIESWLPHKRNGSTAFVGLLDYEEEVPDEAPSLHDYLRQTATRGGMSFFLKAGGWQREPSFSNPAPVPHSAENYPELPPIGWTRGGETEKGHPPCPRIRNRSEPSMIWSSRSRPSRC